MNAATYVRDPVHGGVVAEDATSFRVEQADVRVAARAGETAERLAHERRAVAVQVRELLDRVLEREAGVRPVHALAGGERDLVLRARVLGVVRDHVDPDGSQLVEQRLEERHVRVPYGVEDVHALEEASLRLPVQEVELRLEAEERLIARCAAALERPAVDAAWHRLERLAVAERVADEAAGRYLRPRNDRRRGRVGNDPHVRVARLLRVERAAHDVRARCRELQRRRTCSGRPRRNPRHARSGPSSSGSSRACRGTRSAPSGCRLPASPRGSRPSSAPCRASLLCARCARA